MDKSTPAVSKARRYFRRLVVAAGIASACAGAVLIVQFARVFA